MRRLQGCKAGRDGMWDTQPDKRTRWENGSKTRLDPALMTQVSLWNSTHCSPNFDNSSKGLAVEETKIEKNDK